MCVQLIIYCKETAFLLVLGFAAGRLILRCRAASGAGWDYNRLWERQSRLDLCLAALAVLFLFYYAAGMGLYHYVEGKEVVLYGQGTKHPRAITALTYAKTDCLAWIFIALFLGRICLLACRRVAPWPLWDGLACGGAAYFFVVLYISMFNTYYLAPVDLIAVLYVGRFVILSWPKMHRWGAVAALVLAFTALLQGVVYSALAVFERKNYIHAKSEIATVIKDRYMSGLPSPLKLYFPFAGPYEIMQFGSYLNYRGVPVEGATEEAAAARSIVLATPAVTNNGPCLNWEPVVCHAASSPAPGDLLVVLPNDGASAEEASIYRKSGELLLYEPFPCISQRWYFILKILALPVSFVSDRWMDGSVTLWK